MTTDLADQPLRVDMFRGLTMAAFCMIGMLLRAQMGDVPTGVPGVELASSLGGIHRSHRDPVALGDLPDEVLQHIINDVEALFPGELDLPDGDTPLARIVSYFTPLAIEAEEQATSEQKLRAAMVASSQAVQLETDERNMADDAYRWGLAHNGNGHGPAH